MKALAIAVMSFGVLAADQPRAIVDFQRAADSYAFLHRQVERRLGVPHQRSTLEASELAAAIIADRARGSLPPLFTPAVVVAFRQLAAQSMRAGCDVGELRTGVWEMSHGVNAPATGTRPISGCLVDVLPRLPAELEYRTAGTVLLVVDGHANLVVDVLPGLLAGSDLR